MQLSSTSLFLQPQITNNIGGQFIAHGVRQKVEPKAFYEKFNFDNVPEEDKIWIQIMLKAVSQCGYNSERMATYVQGVVEGIILKKKHY